VPSRSSRSSAIAVARPLARSRVLVLLAALAVVWPLVFFAAANPSRVLAAGAVRLAVTGYADPTTAGTAHTFTVSALKSNNNVDSSYAGIVHFSSSDGQAVLPADAALVNGTRTFTATLKTAGEQSISARDTVVSTIAGSQGAITVGPDVAQNLTFATQPLDTKISALVYSVCAPSGTTAPCALTTASPASAGVKVLARDAYGNNVVNGTPITLGISPNGSGFGAPVSTTNGVADFADTLTAGSSPATISLTADTTFPKHSTFTSTPSNTFQIAVDVKGCSGQKCDNSAITSGQTAFNQITTGSSFFVPGSTNVLLRTQLLQASDFVPGTATCGAPAGLIGQGTEALPQGSGLAAAQPSTSMLIVISKGTLQTNGLTQRSAASFNVCIGATWIDPVNPVVPWAAKNAAGLPVDAQLSGGAYWGLAKNCSTFAANAIDPCIAVATKSTKDVQAYFGWTSAQVAQYMQNSDLALIVRKRFGWDGKAGIFK